MYTYKKKQNQNPNAESSDKSTEKVFPQTEKEFSLIDSEDSPLKKMTSKTAARNRTGLSDKLKSGVENLSGYSLDDVKVHFNSPEPAQFKAAAYTAGKNIFVAPGHESSLPHEAWHVVQQMKGEVSPTDKLNGVNVNENPALEREADIMGKKALSQTTPSASELISVEPPSDVEQFAHTSDFEFPGAPVSGDLVPCEHATLVFECPVKEQKNYDEIYQQSLDYKDRNTICVFGVNSRLGTDFNVKDLKLPAKSDSKGKGTKTPTQKPTKKPADENNFAHLAYVCKFHWSPIDDDNSKGYVFPATEARQILANYSKNITDEIQAANNNNPNPCFTFVFRWLDEDSRENPANYEVLSTEMDNMAKSPSAEFSGGMYDWRLDEDEKAFYHKNTVKFLDSLNAAEIEMRSEYINLSNAGKRVIKPASNSLTGCYVPESTLMMNQAAHNLLINGDNQPANEINGGNLIGTVWGDNTPQDKETMRALMCGGKKVNETIKNKSMVSKPVKPIMTDGEVSSSYLGDPFYNALSYCKGKNEALKNLMTNKVVFYKALKAVRQSVFDPGHWYFVDTSIGDWTEEKNCPKNVDPNLDPIQNLQLQFNRKRWDKADELHEIFKSLFQEKDKNIRERKPADKGKPVPQNKPQVIPQNTSKTNKPKRGKK